MWIFSIITSVFSRHMIILIWWFAAQETFLIIINVENSSDASDFWWIENSQEQNLFEIEIFTVTFDQFNAFMI